MTSRYEYETYTPYLLDTDRQKQKEEQERSFIEFTEAVRKSTIGAMRLGVENVSHEGILSKIESPFLDSDKPELLLAPDVYGRALQTGEGSAPDRLQFEFKPMMGIGKNHSHRTVSFGTGEFLWFRHQNMRFKMPMAVKQFNWGDQKDRRVMLHETVMYEHCADEGIKTLKVLGIARFGTRAALLTYFEPELTTLDNIDWGHQDPFDKELHLDTAVDSIANLHEVLLFHGDAEFRNIPFGQRRGEAFAVDFERTVSLSGETESIDIVERIATRMAQDFRAISKSMTRYGILPEPSPVNGYLDQFLQKFLLKYEFRIHTGNSQNKGRLLAAYGRVVEAFAAELEDKPTEAIFSGLGRAALH